MVAASVNYNIHKVDPLMTNAPGNKWKPASLTCSRFLLDEGQLSSLPLSVYDFEPNWKSISCFFWEKALLLYNTEQWSFWWSFFHIPVTQRMRKCFIAGVLQPGSHYCWFWQLFCFCNLAPNLLEVVGQSVGMQPWGLRIQAVVLYKQVLKLWGGIS